MILNALIHSPSIQSPLTLVQEIVGDNLLSSYLHGSAVTNGLAPNSDIDLLFIVKNALEEETRLALIKELLRLSGEIGNKGGKRALEIIIFSEEAVMQRTTPVTCDFIYGEWLREDFLKGITSLPFQGFEMTLLLAQATQEAVLLQGDDNLKEISNISSLEIVSAIKALAPILLEDLLEDTRNILLTLARMVRTCEMYDFISKKDAVDFVMPRLSSKARVIMMFAKEEYLTGERILWEKRPQDILLTANELYSIIGGFDLTS